MPQPHMFAIWHPPPPSGSLCEAERVLGYQPYGLTNHHQYYLVCIKNEYPVTAFTVIDQPWGRYMGRSGIVDRLILLSPKHSYEV